jgi:hypothetical protein
MGLWGRIRSDRQDLARLRELLRDNGGRMRKSDLRKAGFSTETLEKATGRRVRQTGLGQVGDPYFFELV